MSSFGGTTTFEKRRGESESKFSKDEEMKFKIQARCARLFAEWLADQLGQPADEKEAYAKKMVGLSMSKDALETIKNQAIADVAQNKGDLSDHVLETILNEKLAEAEKQLLAD